MPFGVVLSFDMSDLGGSGGGSQSFTLDQVFKMLELLMSHFCVGSGLKLYIVYNC